MTLPIGGGSARLSGLLDLIWMDTLQEPLGVFLQEMGTQAIDLDEEYVATQKRNQSIADYQVEHPFVPDSDESPAECPSCRRQTTKAGLVYLPENEVKCTYCYTLPRILVDYEAQFGKESEE